MLLLTHKPIELQGNWLDQKLEYINQNRVDSGYVNEAFEYYYSSATNYGYLSCVLSFVF